LVRLAFGWVTSFFGIKVCVFLENDKTDLRQIFLGFRKHFFQGLRAALKSTWPGL